MTAAILALCIYSSYEYSRRHSSVPQIIADPERYENVTFRSEGRVADVRIENETRFTMVIMGDSIDAIYPKPTTLKDDDYIIVYGILHMKSGYLAVTKFHIYKDIRRLYALSITGLALALLLFFRDWKLSFRGLSRRHTDA